MQSCASCGKTGDLRLYEVHDGDHVERRWWCLDCLFTARRLGVTAELTPAWIERAALHQLPMKPLVPAQAGAELAPNLSRSALLHASQRLLALALEPGALALEDDDLDVVDRRSTLSLTT